jgi:hypothetical protein
VLACVGCAGSPPNGVAPNASVAPALIVVRCFMVCRVVIVTEQESLPQGASNSMSDEELRHAFCTAVNQEAAPNTIGVACGK